MRSYHDDGPDERQLRLQERMRRALESGRPDAVPDRAFATELDVVRTDSNPGLPASFASDVARLAVHRSDAVHAVHSFEHRLYQWLAFTAALLLASSALYVPWPDLAGGIRVVYALSPLSGLIVMTFALAILVVAVSKDRQI